MKNNTTYNFVSLFAGIGGEHLALHEALKSSGLIKELDDVKFHAIDFHKRAARSFESNFPETDFKLLDLSDPEVDSNMIGKIDFLWTSCPCTEFSKAKNPKHVLKADIANLTNIVVEKWIAGALPKVVCFENVVQYAGWGPLDENGKRIKERSGEYYKNFINRLNSLGYNVTELKLKAEDFGVASRRNRLYIIGVRRDVADRFEFDYSVLENVEHKYMKDCFDLSIPYKTPVTFCYNKSSRPALEFAKENIPDERFVLPISFGKPVERVLFRLDQKRPAVTTKYGFIITEYGTKGRAVTARENARCMGFPESFVLDESEYQAQIGVGNSVAIPVVAELLKQVFKHVKENFVV